MKIEIAGRTMPQKRIGRCVGIGLVVVACAVALATPVAVAHRTAAHAPSPRGNIANGFRVFNDSFCADCHVMKAAGPASYRGYNVCNGDTACNVGVNFNKILSRTRLRSLWSPRGFRQRCRSTRPRCLPSGRC